MSSDENAKNISTVKHDIKNQLSNITLSLEQLRYEVAQHNADGQYYLDTILLSCKNINNLLDNL